MRGLVYEVAALSLIAAYQRDLGVFLGTLSFPRHR